MNGQINQQGSSYRRGLVLGLTMAEIMLLLVFCLLIAMATFLRTEQNKLAEARKQIEDQRMQSDREHTAVAVSAQETALLEELKSAAGTDPKAIDEYWRELVSSKADLAQLKNEGTSLKDLREKAAAMTVLQKAGINTNSALRDADIIAAIRQALPDGAKATITPQSASELVTRASAPPPTTQAHQWPPIISLSDANGYAFRTGSAELSPQFRDVLLGTTPDEILRFIKEYDVNVIEVVGHTDEQAFGARIASPVVDGPIPLVPMAPATVRQSNLDRGLASVLKNDSDIALLTPVDNAGLGLARAVSVVSVLRQSPKLSGYKMIPLSGGQLVNTDESLALSGALAGDVAQRRRIEIRLRKSTSLEAVAPIAPPQAKTPPPVRRPISPPARPVAAPPTSSRPPSLFNIFGN
jgi:outer membrane protein OmpA-like peptidoglycan-associated protein